MHTVRVAAKELGEDSHRHCLRLKLRDGDKKAFRWLVLRKNASPCHDRREDAMNRHLRVDFALRYLT